MEIELLTKAEASIRPAGLAREEPNENPHLDPPKWVTETEEFYFVYIYLHTENVPIACAAKLVGRQGEQLLGRFVSP